MMAGINYSRKLKPARKTVNWRLSEPLLNKAHDEAARLGLSITAFLEYMMARYFEDLKRQDRQ